MSLVLLLLQRAYKAPERFDELSVLSLQLLAGGDGCLGRPSLLVPFRLEPAKRLCLFGYRHLLPLSQLDYRPLNHQLIHGECSLSANQPYCPSVGRGHAAAGRGLLWPRPLAWLGRH